MRRGYLVNPIFELGSAENVRGHALVYFRDNRATDKLVASYIVVLPVAFEISKYIPPMLASRIPEMKAEMPSVVPLPPVPESVEGFDYLKRLAEMRGDDLVYGGEVDLTSVERSLTILNEVAQVYVKLYQDRLAGQPAVAAEAELGVAEVLYSLMGEKDRLSELAKLTGKLRYAVEGNDRPLIAETVREMEILARFLPEKYKLKDLIRVAQTAGEAGAKLAELYLNRCYKISNEDYRDIEKLDNAIKVLDTGQ